MKRPSLVILSGFMCLLTTVSAQEKVSPVPEVETTVETDISEASDTTTMLKWSVLAPENGKPFNDPFTKLSAEQLSRLSYVVRIRRLIAEEKIEPEGVDAQEITKIASKLKQEGVDIHWLMAQRKRVQQWRDLQVGSVSKSIAKSLNDKKVTLTGYVIPIKVIQKKVTEFFLVPTSAACSNEAAPPRLKVVFVSTKQGFDRPDKGVPVRVTGRVKAQATTNIIRAGIAVRNIQSAYTVLSPKVEVYPRHRQERISLKK